MAAPGAGVRLVALVRAGRQGGQALRSVGRCSWACLACTGLHSPAPALIAPPRLPTPGLPPSEPNVVALYEKLGFVADPDGIRGVAYQSKLARQLQMANGRRR